MSYAYGGVCDVCSSPNSLYEVTIIVTPVYSTGSNFRHKVKPFEIHNVTLCEKCMHMLINELRNLSEKLTHEINKLKIINARVREGD